MRGSEPDAAHLHSQEASLAGPMSVVGFTDSTRQHTRTQMDMSEAAERMYVQ
jgi:hypothetical protein